MNKKIIYILIAILLLGIYIYSSKGNERNYKLLVDYYDNNSSSVANKEYLEVPYRFEYHENGDLLIRWEKTIINDEFILKTPFILTYTWNLHDDVIFIEYENFGDMDRAAEIYKIAVYIDYDYTKNIKYLEYEFSSEYTQSFEHFDESSTMGSILINYLKNISSVANRGIIEVLGR